MEKKKMKLWKKILIALLIFFILFALLVLRNFIIISQLVESSKEFVNKTNYVAVGQSLQGGNINMLKSYNKDGNYLTTIKTYGKDIQNERGITVYNKDNEKIGIIQNGQEKIAILDNIVFGKVTVVNVFSSFESTLQQLQISVMSRITTDNCNNTECYLIELDNWRMWVDKNSGLVLREINGSFVTERFYEFDIVKDKDIIKPDISDCEIQ